MINLAYDYQAFCNSKYGGIARYVYELASRSATSEEFKVRILAGLYTNDYLKDGQAQGVRGIQVPFVPKTSSILQAINSQLVGSYLKLRKPHIFHETYYSRRNITPKSQSCKTVLTVYDMIHEKFRHMMTPREQQTIQSKKAAIQRADHIICISEQTKQDLIEIFSLPSEMVSTVHLGFSLTQNQHVEDEVAIIDRPYLLYVGARRTYKNFNGFIRAYASSESLKKTFSVVCFGHHTFSESEYNLFRELGLTQEQIIYKSGNDQTLANLYQHAAALIYPSLYEGFGIPPLEAMSFQCPVICSNAGSIPEVAGNAAAYFDPYVSESIIDSIQSVVFSSTRVSELTQAGQQRLSLFSWEKCASETQKIYHQILTAS